MSKYDCCNLGIFSMILCSCLSFIIFVLCPIECKNWYQYECQCQVVNTTTGDIILIKDDKICGVIHNFMGMDCTKPFGCNYYSYDNTCDIYHKNCIDEQYSENKMIFFRLFLIFISLLTIFSIFILILYVKNYKNDRKHNIDNINIQDVIYNNIV